MSSIDNITYPQRDTPPERDVSLFIPVTYVLRLTDGTLWTLLGLRYLLSGVRTFASNYAYCMWLMSFLVLRLLVSGVRVAGLFPGCALLVGVIFLPGQVNSFV